MRVERIGRFEFSRAWFVDNEGRGILEGTTASFSVAEGGSGSVLFWTSEEEDGALEFLGGLPSLGLEPTSAPSLMCATLHDDQWKVSSLDSPLAKAPTLTCTVDRDGLEIISKGPSNFGHKDWGFSTLT